MSKKIDMKVNSIVGLLNFDKDEREIFSSLVFNMTDSKNSQYRWQGLVVSYYDIDEKILYFKEIFGLDCREMPFEFHSIFSEAIEKYLGDFLFDTYIKCLDYKSIFVDKSIDRFGTHEQVFEITGIKSHA